MLPPKLALPPAQQRLLRLFRQLPEAEQESLLAFAEFLVQRVQPAASAAPSSEAEERQPLDIPRPASESVVAAIRRLNMTFPMLDRDALLHEASALMTAHVMQGRPAAEVIDELEAVFRRHYERVKSLPE
jgi:hypothetical protein